MDTESEQIQQARRALRSQLFELTRSKLLPERLALHLLRVVEQTLRTSDQPPVMGTAASLHIKDEDNPVTWRAYPSDTTTLEELLRACAEFNLVPWVDLDSQVALILRNPVDNATRPDCVMLAECMFGCGDMINGDDPTAAPVPAFLKRQAD